MPSKSERIRQLQTVDAVRGLLVDLLPRLGLDMPPVEASGNRALVRASKNNLIEGRPDRYLFVLVPEGATSDDEGVRSAVSLVNGVPTASSALVVRVVTPRSFSNTARDQVRERTGIRSLEVWDGDHLLTLIDRAYPEYWQFGSDAYKKYAARAVDKFQSDYAVTAIRLQDRASAELFEGILLPFLVEYVTGPEGVAMPRIAKVESILDPGGVAMIGGEAGSGKSTLLRLLAQRVVKDATAQEQRLPVLLRFSDLERKAFDLDSAVTDFLTGPDFSDLAIDVKAVLRDGRVVVFVDALDEVARSDVKDEALDAVVAFAERWPSVKVVCSSRPSDRLVERSRDGDIQYFMTTPLRPEQVQRFITQYFRDDSERGERLLRALRDHELLDKLPRTPLTLTLIATIFEKSNFTEVPATASDMYGQFVGLLTGRLTADTTLGILGANVHNDALEALAVRLHTDQRQTMPREEFLVAVAEFVTGRGGKMRKPLRMSSLSGPASCS